jgi:hypothetical protein
MLLFIPANWYERGIETGLCQTGATARYYTYARGQSDCSAGRAENKLSQRNLHSTLTEIFDIALYPYPYDSIPLRMAVPVIETSTKSCKAFETGLQDFVLEYRTS